MQYIRVKDKDTKHEFDVPEGSPLLAKGLVEPVKGDRYPASRVARPVKHHVTVKPAGQSAPTTTQKES